MILYYRSIECAVLAVFPAVFSWPCSCPAVFVMFDVYDSSFPDNLFQVMSTHLLLKMINAVAFFQLQCLGGVILSYSLSI